MSWIKYCRKIICVFQIHGCLLVFSLDCAFFCVIIPVMIPFCCCQIKAQSCEEKMCERVMGWVACTWVVTVLDSGKTRLVVSRKQSCPQQYDTLSEGITALAKPINLKYNMKCHMFSVCYPLLKAIFVVVITRRIKKNLFFYINVYRRDKPSTKWIDVISMIISNKDQSQQ